MALKEEHKQALWIVGFGAVGGILSCVYAAVVGSSSEEHWFWRSLGSTVLGAGASFVGAYLLANPDMREAQGRMRGWAFALICGFAWKPVYDAGTALVDKTAEDMNDRPILSEVNASEARAMELDNAPPAQLP